MLAARLHEIGKPMQLEQVPIPTPRPTDVVVQVKACNVVPNLKNVLATYAEWFPYLPLPKLPAIFGLDSAGVVTEVGDQVRGIQVGDRVYVNPGLSCGSCRACRRGEDQNCPAYTFMGYFAFGPGGQKLFDAYPYGGLAEYLTAPERNLVALPDSVTFEQGARFGYLGTAFSACASCARPAPDPAAPCSSTASPAPSASAPASSRWASASPASSAPAATPTCSTTSRPSHPAGSTCCPPGTAHLPDWVRERTDGEGVDIVIDALGPGAPAEAMLEAVDSLARGGVLVDIGGMMERPGLDLFAMMCSQRSVLAACGSPPGRPRTWPTWPAPARWTCRSSNTTPSRSHRSTRRSTPSRSGTVSTSSAP